MSEPPTPSAKALRTRSVARIDGDGLTRRALELVAEAPLEIRVSGEALAVTMRTPGHDRELALGFLFAEGIVRDIDDVGSVAHCGRTGDPRRENVIDVIAAPGVVFDLERTEASRRGTITTSACGACGRASIDDLLASAPSVETPRPLSLDEIGPMLSHLRASQPVFARSGGCHGAALFEAASLTHVATYEDLGRHNAIDKLLGARLLARKDLERVSRTRPLAGGVLVVSGRSSFEVVHKALVGGAGALVALGAPSDLAADMAERAGLPLGGFAEPDGAERYA
ncbi:MAG: formate dehydrogenase accessory sulfurtransferase FdhD [Sandaracinaceae bacterium]|nr:formate dehydrogenase accessory sulfurtransferase FdhD [Sandaracinaceae bacterium]